MFGMAGEEKEEMGEDVRGTLGLEGDMTQDSPSQSSISRSSSSSKSNQRLRLDAFGGGGIEESREVERLGCSWVGEGEDGAMEDPRELLVGDDGATDEGAHIVGDEGARENSRARDCKSWSEFKLVEPSHVRNSPSHQICRRMPC